MPDVTSINGTGSPPGIQFTQSARVHATTVADDPADQLEISEIARLLSSLDPEEQAGIRTQKVSDIREAIAQGTYETDDKIQYVVGRLMEVLREEMVTAEE